MKNLTGRPIVIISLLVLAAFVANESLVRGQRAGNTISGIVYGIERRPLSDVNVELLDDYSRTIARTRTNATGSYTFYVASDGRFTIRVMPFGTNYQEQENSVEIQNITTQTAPGQFRTGGFANEQSNFYLKLRKGVTPEMALGVVFAQEVPENAKELYDKALVDLENEREAEGQATLRSAIEIFPKYYAALERLGTEYIGMNKRPGYEAAEVLLTVAVDVNPRGYKSWYGLAYARYSLGKYSTALEAAKKAVELNSQSAEALFLTGSLQRHNKNYGEAEKQLLKAKELAIDAIPQLHWELALLYGNHMKRYADAAKQLKVFLKTQPGARDTEMIEKLIADFEAKAQKK